MHLIINGLRCRRGNMGICHSKAEAEAEVEAEAEAEVRYEI